MTEGAVGAERAEEEQAAPGVRGDHARHEVEIVIDDARVDGVDVP